VRLGHEGAGRARAEELSQCPAHAAVQKTAWLAARMAAWLSGTSRKGGRATRAQATVQEAPDHARPCWCGVPARQAALRIYVERVVTPVWSDLGRASCHSRRDVWVTGLDVARGRSRTRMARNRRARAEIGGHALLTAGRADCRPLSGYGPGADEDAMVTVAGVLRHGVRARRVGLCSRPPARAVHGTGDPRSGPLPRRGGDSRVTGDSA